MFDGSKLRWVLKDLKKQATIVAKGYKIWRIFFTNEEITR